jgi:hypothetical protein
MIMKRGLKMMTVLAVLSISVPAVASAQDGWTDHRGRWVEYEDGYGDGYRHGNRDAGSRYDEGYGDGFGEGYEEARVREIRRSSPQACRSGAGGTIVGGVAGALLGNQIVRKRSDRTVGTIIGGGLGALAGRAIDRRC